MTQLSPAWFDQFNQISARGRQVRPEVRSMPIAAPDAVMAGQLQQLIGATVATVVGVKQQQARTRAEAEREQEQQRQEAEQIERDQISLRALEFVNEQDRGGNPEPPADFVSERNKGLFDVAVQTERMRRRTAGERARFDQALGMADVYGYAGGSFDHYLDAVFPQGKPADLAPEQQRELELRYIQGQATHASESINAELETLASSYQATPEMFGELPDFEGIASRRMMEVLNSAPDPVYRQLLQVQLERRSLAKARDLANRAWPAHAELMRRRVLNGARDQVEQSIVLGDQAELDAALESMTSAYMDAFSVARGKARDMAVGDVVGSLDDTGLERVAKWAHAPAALKQQVRDEQTRRVELQRKEANRKANTLYSTSLSQVWGPLDDTVPTDASGRPMRPWPQAAARFQLQSLQDQVANDPLLDDQQKGKLLSDLYEKRQALEQQYQAIEQADDLVSGRARAEGVSYEKTDLLDKAMERRFRLELAAAGGNPQREASTYFEFMRTVGWLPDAVMQSYRGLAESTLPGDRERWLAITEQMLKVPGFRAQAAEGMGGSFAGRQIRHLSMLKSVYSRDLAGEDIRLKVLRITPDSEREADDRLETLGLRPSLVKLFDSAAIGDEPSVVSGQAVGLWDTIYQTEFARSLAAGVGDLDSAAKRAADTATRQVYANNVNVNIAGVQHVIPKAILRDSARDVPFLESGNFQAYIESKTQLSSWFNLPGADPKRERFEAEGLHRGLMGFMFGKTFEWRIDFDRYNQDSGFVPLQVYNADLDLWQDHDSVKLPVNQEDLFRWHEVFSRSYDTGDIFKSLHIDWAKMQEYEFGVATPAQPIR